MDLTAPHLRYKDQDRRERTWTIHLIAADKVLKGAFLVIVALRMLTLLGSDVHAWAEDFVSRHGIDLANRFVQDVLQRLVGFGNRQLITWSAAAVIYSALLFVEGFGLWMQKRWAEYVTAISTALFIPLELYEMYEKFTWIRVAILIVNLFIVWYLVTRLRDESRSHPREPKQVSVDGA